MIVARIGVVEGEEARSGLSVAAVRSTGIAVALEGTGTRPGSTAVFVLGRRTADVVADIRDANGVRPAQIVEGLVDALPKIAATRITAAISIVLATGRRPAQAIAAAALVTAGAKVPVAAGAGKEGPHARTRAGVARIARAGIAVIAAQRRVAALPSGRIAEILGARHPVAAIFRGSLAKDRSPRGRDADIVRRAQTLIVAWASGRQRTSDALAALRATVPARAGISVLAHLAGRQYLPGALTRRSGGGDTGIAGRAGVIVAAG